MVCFLFGIHDRYPIWFIVTMVVSRHTPTNNRLSFIDQPDAAQRMLPVVFNTFPAQNSPCVNRSTPKVTSNPLGKTLCCRSRNSNTNQLLSYACIFCTKKHRAISGKRCATVNGARRCMAASPGGWGVGWTLLLGEVINWNLKSAGYALR
jgi:hypothetical protein